MRKMRKVLEENKLTVVIKTFMRTQFTLEIYGYRK